MSLYLNKGNEYFSMCLNSDIYVDKSNLIAYCNSLLNTSGKYMCVTRFRRSGKTMALAMLNAYYSKGCDSKDLFEGLQIENDESYLTHLNKHKVIWIDMGGVYTDIDDKLLFVQKLNNGILNDFKRTYKSISIEGMTLREAIKELNSELGERFIFLIDEWDIIYREQANNTKLCEEYTNFLRDLFGSPDVSNCIDLVFMTGILPIRRYSNKLTIEMFKEYNMTYGGELATYFGFTDLEVRELCSKYNCDYKEIKEWYSGYKLSSIEFYNPLAIVRAISYGECDDYWTHTSSIEALTNYMNYDNGSLKGIFAKMIAGDKVDVDVTKFSYDLTMIDSRDAALTILIQYGYLAYDEINKVCYIPNYEIRQEFERALRKLNWGDLYNPISNSKKLYEETLKGNTDFINHVFDQNYKELAGPFNKNKEDILGVITLISYYSVKQFYDIHKEVNTTLGRADIVFIPKDNNHIPMIIELKVDSTPDEAIKQIKDKEYVNTLGSYKGDVLLLGISYDSNTLKHSSKIEYITK